MIPSSSSNKSNSGSLYSSSNINEVSSSTTLANNNNNSNNNKPYQPFNSQTGQFFQRGELDNTVNGFAKSNSGHSQNRTSNMFSTSNMSHVIHNIGNMIGSTLTPNATSNTLGKHQISSPMSTSRMPSTHLNPNQSSAVSSTSLNNSSLVLSPLAYSDNGALNSSAGSYKSR